MQSKWMFGPLASSLTVRTSSLNNRVVVFGIFASLLYSSVFAQKPSFSGKASAGSTSITISGQQGDAITIYAYDQGYSLTGTDNAACQNGDVGHRTALAVSTASSGGGTGTTTAPTINVTAPSTPKAGDTTTETFTLAQPLVAGTTLCLADTGSNIVNWSAPTPVNDPNDNGRFRTYFIAGLQANNQLSASSSASSTAGEYLELGFVNSWLRARDKYDQRALLRLRATEMNLEASQITNQDVAQDAAKAATKATDQKAAKNLSDRADKVPHWQSPGLTSTLDVRLSPITVGGTQSTTTTGSTTTATVPNSLSSQQAVRIVANGYAPWKLTSWNAHNDFFTLGPLVRGGFGTLINPSSTSTSVSTSGNAQQTVTSTTNFNSAYYAWSMGGRLAWDRYSANTDKAPQSFGQLLMTFGEFSNLPSYVCQAKTGGGTTIAGASGTTVATSCGQGSNMNLPTPSHTLIPRLDLEGFVRLPNLPFVLGAEANLQQYSIFSKSNIDYVNKPGNDIRVYLGVQIDLGTLISHTGFTMP